MTTILSCVSSRFSPQRLLIGLRRCAVAFGGSKSGSTHIEGLGQILLDGADTLVLQRNIFNSVNPQVKVAFIE
jgi:hypothetical protein